MESQRAPNKNIHTGVNRVSRGLDEMIDHTERLEYDHLMDNVDQKYQPNEIHEQTRDIDLPFQNKQITICFDENVTSSNANSAAKKELENISVPPSTKNKDVVKSTQRNRFARSNKMDLMNSVRRGPETRKRREYKWGDEDDEDEFGSELRKAKNRMREPSNERLVCDASFVDTARDHDTDEKKAPMKQYVMQEN
jgi:hypothetical protein